jgi:hypothetical protein
VAPSTRFEIRRHCRELSEKDTDAVVHAVADLIVSYLKRDPDPGRIETRKRPTAGAAAPMKESNA